MPTLIVCVIVHILLAVCFKMFVRLQVQAFVAIVYNYLVCMLLGSLMVGHVPLIEYGFETRWVPYGLALGCIFIGGFNAAALSVRHAGITVTTIMQKMSLLLSAGFAIICFNELLGPFKATGLVISCIAIILVNMKPTAVISASARAKALLFPVLIFLASGLIEIILYFVHARGLSHDADAELTTYAFSVAGVVGGLALVWLYATGKVPFQWKDVIGGVALGIPNFFSIYLILVLLGTGFEGSVLYPVLNVSIVIGATLVGVAGFRERIEPVNVVGFIAAITAIVLISWR